MGTVVLNQSNFDKSDFELLNASHSPSLILLEEDVDLGGNTLYFVPGDVLRANGGTLGGGQIRGVVSIEDTCQQLFRLDDNGKCTVEFSYIIDKGKNAQNKKIEEKRIATLNVPYLRPEWFGAKGDLVFKFLDYTVDDALEDDNPEESKLEDNNVNVIELTLLDQYNKNECTRNSKAINETIRVAEELSIKTIKFNAANYFVEEGIVIHKGNLRLEGSGALLREDQWFVKDNGRGGHGSTQIKNSRTSTLFCPKGVSLITIGEELGVDEKPVFPTSYADSKNPGDPVVISDLQLWTEGNVWNDYEPEKDYLPSGINFCSCCGAPLWPFIIERCHFSNFMYAVHINTIIDYPVTYLRINECAFFHNMYCLYSRMRPKWEETLAEKKDDEIILQNEPWLQTSWSLEFTRNKCHDNGFVMRTAVNKGPCRIEYNNLEGASGFERKKKSEPGVFAVDLELGQRAAAVIRYNHFEMSRPRLVRVKGFWPNTWVTMRHNNRDGNTGSYEASNLCYFEGVILNTDEDAEVCNCIYENVPYQGKKLQIKECTTDGTRLPVGSVFLRELPARPLKGGVSRYYKLNPQAETAPHTHVYMQTPMGRMLMRYYYEINVNYEHVFYLVSQEFDYEEDGPLYVTIDFPLINECNTQPLDITTHLQYGGETVNRGNHTYLYYDKGGFFNVRQQFMVCHETAKKFKISLGITAGTLLPIEGRFFVGNIVVMFSDAPLDMNFRLMDNRSVTLKENDSYLANKGDILTIEGYLYVCLEDGYMATGKVGFTKQAYSNVIKLNSNTILPAGSIWICKGYMFKILAPNTYNTETSKDTTLPRYTQISYLTETDAFDVALSDELERYDPDLLSL